MQLLDLQALRDNPKIVIDSDHGWGRQYRFINERYCAKGYCTKFLELTKPGIKGSLHKHKEKHETWLVLDGIINVYIFGAWKKLLAGDTVFIRPGIEHQFYADRPSLILEGSTYDDDDDTYRINDEGKFINTEGVIHIGIYVEQEAIHRRMTKEFEKSRIPQGGKGEQ